MKRFLSGLMALLLLGVLAVPALAADSGYTMSIQVNGQENTTVALGSTVTVTLTMSKNDADSFTLYSMQDYIRFDTDHFSYVDGSLAAYTTTGETLVQVFSASVVDYPGSGGKDNAIFVNRASGTEQTLSSGVTVVTFQLKAIQNGTTMLTHSTTEVFQTPGALFGTTCDNAVVTISNNAGGNTGSGTGTGTGTGSGIGSGTGTGTGASPLPFVDVAENSWYCQAVKYVYENGLMNGISETLFAPNAKLTRAMIAQVLYNLEGETKSYPTAFDDVFANAWYADAVNWAAANGIVEGYGNGKFGPSDHITREQMATILYRYAAFKGYDVGNSESLDQFLDANEISNWARSAMSWAVAEKLINGKGGGILDAAGTATRAEVAQILMNYCQNIL